MIKFVSAFVKRENRDLSVDERNILSVAYKNVIGSRRSAWRIMNGYEQKEGRKGNDDNASKIAEYKRDIEQELNNLTSEILDLINNDLFPRATTGESKVFYRKMEGDYYRYVCEYSSGEVRESNSGKARNSY